MQSSQTIEAPTALQTITLDVGGMKCAGCVSAVERQIQQHEGVVAARVNLVTEMAVVQYEADKADPERIATTLTQRGFPSQLRGDKRPGEGATEAVEKRRHAEREQLRQLAIAGLLILFSGVGHLGHWGGPHVPVLSNLWVHWVLATLALVFPGREILIDGVKGLWHRTPNMNSLVALGTVSAYAASCVALFFPQLGWECFFDEPVMLLGFILLGRTLEQRARNRASAALEALVSLQPQTARIAGKDGQPGLEIPVEQVRVGDALQVLPGEKMPVDGTITRGDTSVDESMLTGESVPVAKQEGDPVAAGTLNQSGTIWMQATQIGENTSLAKIVASVEEAQTRKAPVQKLADTVAGYFSYGVMTIASLTFLFWYLAGTQIWPYLSVETTPLLLSLKLGVAVLVIACPCALGLATPTAILVGTSIGAERGLLIKGGDILEDIHRVDTVVFDKTGTLTVGQPTVTDCIPLGDISPDSLLQIAATAESGTNHPLAEAIARTARDRGLELLAGDRFHTAAGFGITASVDGQKVILGKLEWLRSSNISLSETAWMKVRDLGASGKTVVGVAIDGQLSGLIALEDRLREDAKATVERLQDMGLTVHLITGDEAGVAKAIAARVGIPEANVLAGVHPEAKGDRLASLQQAGSVVAMVGDGINDAPALARADVGIAMHNGTEVAVETAGIVLMRDRLLDSVESIKLSLATLGKIRQNLLWALGYNLVAIPVAAGILLPRFGILLSPAAAAGFMAFSSVAVVTNSLLLRRRFAS